MKTEKQLRDEFDSFVKSGEFQRIVYGLNYLAVIMPILMKINQENDTKDFKNDGKDKQEINKSKSLS